jgi:hypothetical protein
MPLVAAMLVVGLVIGIAAVIVVREAGRLAKEPPLPVFDLQEAYEWVVTHVPDDVAATLTPEDVRRILDLQVEFFKRKGVSGNGSSGRPAGSVVIGGAETVEYIIERAAAAGESYLPEQVHAVIDTQLSYLRAIGAIGPPAGSGPGDADPSP